MAQSTQPAQIALDLRRKRSKGNYAGRELLLSSGPIRSCAPYSVHAKFRIGDQLIFILPAFPTDGKSRLVWGGSVRSISETTFVESTLGRLHAYRQQYIDELRRINIDAFKKVQLLNDEMTKSFALWPAVEERLFPPGAEAMAAGSIDIVGTNSPKPHIETLLTRLEKLDLETIRAAMALNWLNDAPISWSKHPVWTSAVQNAAVARRKEYDKFERRRLEKLLAIAGAEGENAKRLVDAAVSSLRKNTLTFPPETPDLREEDLTTDFIIRYHSYDRGMMLVYYAGDFSAEVLVGLDVPRARPYIESLYSSQDERLRWLAGQAIGYSATIEFSGMVLEKMLDGDVYEWRQLAHNRNAKATPLKLQALVEHGINSRQDWRIDGLWEALRRGECFHPVVMEQAIKFAEQCEEKIKTKTVDQERQDEDPMERKSVVHKYLVAAIAAHEAKAPAQRTAAEYREWLKANRETITPKDEREAEDVDPSR